MKYISFIDQLDYSIDKLSHIDSNGIIKLQKQLKAKAMLGDANNLGEVAALIEKLKDETTRKNYIFVEKHGWLKQLISGHHEFIKQSEISIDKSEIYNLEDIKYFLSSYLKENIKVFLSESLTKGKYVVMLKVLTHNYLFPEEINQLIINFFKARLNYATVYLREKRLKDKEYPIAFITNKVFINCLNEYPDCFNEDIQELNSEVIDVYNSNRRNIDNDQFKFAAKTMVALSILDTSNIFLEETLKSNADIAREYAYSSRSSRKTGSGFGPWSIFVIIMIVLRVIFWISKSSSSNSNYEYIKPGEYNTGYSEDFQKIIDSIQNSKSQGEDFEVDEAIPTAAYSDDRFKSENHIKFMYTLKLNVERKSTDPTAGIDVKPFSNPYPKTFNSIPHNIENSDNSLVKINNQSKKDLIVFRLTQGVDQSIFIPENKNLYIQITKNDSLVFYTGKDFDSARFSHFKHDKDLSSMLKVSDINTSSRKEITVYPFQNKVSRIQSTSSNKVIIDTLRTEQLNTKSLELQKLNINEIYRDYYNNKYRN